MNPFLVEAIAAPGKVIEDFFVSSFLVRSKVWTLV
jgi:hypothetical protein